MLWVEASSLLWCPTLSLVPLCQILPALGHHVLLRKKIDVSQVSEVAISQSVYLGKHTAKSVNKMAFWIHEIEAVRQQISSERAKSRRTTNSEAYKMEWSTR